MPFLSSFFSEYCTYAFDHTQCLFLSTWHTYFPTNMRLTKCMIGKPTKLCVFEPIGPHCGIFFANLPSEAPENSGRSGFPSALASHSSGQTEPSSWAHPWTLQRCCHLREQKDFGYTYINTSPSLSFHFLRKSKMQSAWHCTRLCYFFYTTIPITAMCMILVYRILIHYLHLLWDIMSV